MTSPCRCLDCRASILPPPTYRANSRRWDFRISLRISFPRSPPLLCGASLRFRSCFPCRQIHAVPTYRFHFLHKSGSTTFYLSFLQSLLPLICFLLSIRGNRRCDICCALTIVILLPIDFNNQSAFLLFKVPRNFVCRVAFVRLVQPFREVRALTFLSCPRRISEGCRRDIFWYRQQAFAFLFDKPAPW